MVKVIVLGHKGFIGSYVMKLFPNAIGYDLKDGKNILDYSKLYRVIVKNKIDTIIHLAASISIPESEEKPQEYIENNIQGTMQVIDVALKTGVKKIVYASSSACSEPTSSIYAITKLVPELLLNHYKDRLEVISLRFFNVYGKGSNPAYGRVIDSFVAGIKSKQEIVIYGDGQQTRDFIHVKDIASGIKAAATKKIPSGEVIDLGTGISISINQLASMIITGMGILPKRIYKPQRKEVKHSRVDLTKARKLLEFSPKITLQEGLREIIMETI